ncbi:ABC transporter permease [Sutcliffiella sp. NC1]|uniref:ABC transporter permease n=1 Tax=Sutcliffiella sp. NC1 TaxID=3004096 RepID=UPI0022DDA3D4|nr:ABC transporter permease [Sutcliffiella sp. NC1]WBL13139.1 ABC transporter permease [Sutcliffiella sp. NC1]
MGIDIKKLFKNRVSSFYKEMTKYYTIIFMSVFYSFLILGSIFVYYYVKFIQWIPPFLSSEWIASVITALILLQSTIRTFVREADTIFLLPMETHLSSYFLKTLIYNGILHLLKMTIVIAIMFPLIESNIILTVQFLLLLVGLVMINVYLVWIEQWIDSLRGRFIHKLNLLISYALIFYFLFKGNWVIALILLLLTYGFSFYIFPLGARRLNWEYLNKQEEKALTKNYRFINIYIDVGHLKRSFQPRLFLTRLIKNWIPPQPYNSFFYLYVLLFIRLNDYFYLYLRLTLIGTILVWVFPEYGWLTVPIILFMTGYQLLPLKREQNDFVILYPVSNMVKMKSYLKLLYILLIFQLVVVNVPVFFHSISGKTLISVFTELLFIGWFVLIFAKKRYDD